MSTIPLPSPLAPLPSSRTAWSPAFDYVDLCRPKIAALELVTVAVAAFIAGWGPPDAALVLPLLAGTLLVAASASALNQWLEAETDALMPRTADRPLPAGRLSPRQVVAFGVITVVVGTILLAVAVNPLTAVLGLASWALYVFVYTPLKSRTWLNTVVGAVSGALPILMGWTAAGGSLGLGAATLFLIVFLWQFPHFMAIAWLYRREYASAGLAMLSVVDPSGLRAGRQAVTGALLLVPVSLVPALLHLAGPAYAVGAIALGLGQVAAAGLFLCRRDEQCARLLLRASLVYLPAILCLLMLVPLV